MREKSDLTCAKRATEDSNNVAQNKILAHCYTPNTTHQTQHT